MSGLRLSRFYATTPPVVADTTSESCAPPPSCQPHLCPSVPRSKIPVVVLTGGPCGGKSTLLGALLKKGAIGKLRVLGVSEIATDFKKHGVPFDYQSSEESGIGEQSLVQHQCSKENVVMAHAKPKQPGARSVVICDRGAVDAAAYCEPSVWQHVLAECHVTEEALHARYDFVLHVTSIAVDKPALYHSFNNAARGEDSSAAAGLDAKVAAAWRKHPNRHVLSNDFPSFDAKIAEGVRQVASFVESYYTKQTPGELQELRWAS